MIARKPRYPIDEFARRGESLYETNIRPLVEDDNVGQYIAIDIETGVWKMDPSEDVASERLRELIPDAQTYMTRVGFGYIRKFGAGRGKIPSMRSIPTLYSE